MPENSEEPKKEEKLDREWMIRDCDLYCDEYSECTSIKARFHQYFIFGETLDCSQWKRDCDNCYKWIDNNDIKAAKEIIQSETKRRLTRLRGHYENDVWQKRDSPPVDWSKPLPEEMRKEYEHSYLHIKSLEEKGEIMKEDTKTFCSIM